MKFKTLADTFIFFVQLSFFTNLSCRAYDAVINLGEDCQVAYQLSINNLRFYALPFDWLITPFSSLCDLLENSFKDFLQKENLNLIENKFVIDNYYQVKLFHDFKLTRDFLDDYILIKEKYDRRVDRFYYILSLKNNVLFVRKNITKNQSKQLIILLDRCFSDLEYTLLALDNSEEIKKNWNIDKVKNYFLRQPEPYSWKGDSQARQDILKNFNIKIEGYN